MKLHVDQDGNPHLDATQTITFTRNDYCFGMSMDEPGIGYCPCNINFKNLHIVGTHGSRGRIGRFWNLAKHLWRFVK